MSIFKSGISGSVRISMWETPFARNTQAGFCKDFTTLSYTKEYVRFVNFFTKSGLGISRKCCFPHGRICPDEVRCMSSDAVLVCTKQKPNLIVASKKSHFLSLSPLYAVILCTKRDPSDYKPHGHMRFLCEKQRLVGKQADA